MWMQIRIGADASAAESSHYAQCTLDLWFPLIVLWVVASLLVLLLSPLLLVGACVFALMGWGRLVLRFLPSCWEVCSALSGLEIKVIDHGRQSVWIVVK